MPTLAPLPIRNPLIFVVIPSEQAQGGVGRLLEQRKADAMRHWNEPTERLLAMQEIDAEDELSWGAPQNLIHVL